MLTRKVLIVAAILPLFPMPSPDAWSTPLVIHIDRGSMLCMDCHPERAPSLGTIDGMAPREHPIGVPYPTASSLDYRPIHEVRSAVHLPDGRVACTSCHDDQSEIHGQLHVTGTGLCTTCHAL